MKDGYIQQVDSPINLYDKPVNKFVAGFIGSPAMNFMVGTVQDGHLRSPQFDLKPHDELLGKLGAHNGKKVYVGIRPEDIDLKGYTDIPEGNNVIRATVEVVSRSAPRPVIATVGGDQTIVARVDAHADVRAGDEVEFSPASTSSTFDMWRGAQPALRVTSKREPTARLT